MGLKNEVIILVSIETDTWASIMKESRVEFSYVNGAEVYPGVSNGQQY